MKVFVFKAVSIFIFSFLINSLHAQAPDTIWTRTFGFREYEYAVGAFQLPSGDFLVGGTQQDTTNYDYAGWIFRVDASGNIVSEHHTGYSDLDEGLYSMCSAPDYTFVLTGFAEHSTDPIELYAVKCDTNTSVLYTNRLGGNHNHIGNGVTVLPSGQCVFVGELQMTPHQGLLNWTFPDLGFMFQNNYPVGAWLDLYAINQTLDSCLIVTGKIQPTTGDSWFYFLMKLSSTGSFMGSQFYGSGSDDQIPYWVEATLDGGYIICGYTTVGGMPNDRDLYIVKVDSTFNLEWIKRYEQSEGRMIIRHPEGGYVLVGNDRQPLGILVMRLDENGDSLWAKTIPGATGNSISRTSDGGYIVAGATVYTPGRKNDAFLARLAPEPTKISYREQTIPDEFVLFQNHPNPFNPITTIRFDLLKSGDVQLIVYDILGRKVATLVNKKMPSGKHKVELKAANYASGLYFYQLTAGKFKEVKKMLLLK